ncbi:MAG: hypothetical protein FD166_3732, partial [Bacteroidetes bacterium]
NYAIQGNILLGQQILDSMEARFLNEPGDLACKLMAALQGANVIGADTRCTSSGNSSLSSFLRVAKPSDVMPNIYLNLVVAQGPAGFEPIDSLQTRFDLVHSCLTGVLEKDVMTFSVKVRPNPATDKLKIILPEIKDEKFHLSILNSLGQEVFSEEMNAAREVSINITTLEKGIYFYKITLQDGKIASGKIMKD